MNAFCRIFLNRFHLFTFFIVFISQSIQAQEINEYKDVIYAEVGGMQLKLDIYMPAGVTSPPLIVYAHGGGWRGGSKNMGLNIAPEFLNEGFAFASLDFRSTSDAQFPAMIHDIKGAIRFLRASQESFGYNSEQIAIMGSSSGGHLAALVGVTNGHPELEGNIGENLEFSSSIQSIISYFGASDLTTILSQSTPRGLRVREPTLEFLLGALPDEVPGLANLASPVQHLDNSDPPLFLLHGDRDPQMPINQSHQLEGAYEALGLDVYFDVVHGAGHGFNQSNIPLFFSEEHFARVIDFLNRTIVN